MLQQRPLTLAFRSPLVEAEYGAWAALSRSTADLLSGLLLLASLVVICFVGVRGLWALPRPLRRAAGAPRAVPLHPRLGPATAPLSLCVPPAPPAPAAVPTD